MNLQARLAKWQAEVSKYLRERNILSALVDKQLEFAVIAAWKCDEQAIQRLANELVTWVTENYGAQIFGLDQMLEGRQPEAASSLFCIPMLMGSSDTQTWTEKVALVVCAKNHNEQAKLGASLSELVKRHAPAWTDSYEAYCDRSR